MHFFITQRRICPVLSTFFAVIALTLGTAGALANPAPQEIIAAARSGDAKAQYMAGMSYLFGQGVRQSTPEAVHWLEQSASGGVPQAMVALAGLYDVGQGVPFDAERATALRQQAAHAGNPTARGQLADDSRMRGQRDFRRANILDDLHLNAAAIPYAERAAAAGSGNALLLLGHAYHFGLGVPVDKAKAFRLYQKAAAAGLEDGNRSLAYAYEFGVGTGVNRKLALVYYDRAAAKGSSLARRAAANLRSPDYYARPQGFGGGNGVTPNSGYPTECSLNGGHYDGTTCYNGNRVPMDPHDGQTDHN